VGNTEVDADSLHRHRYAICGSPSQSFNVPTSAGLDAAMNIPLHRFKIDWC